MKITQRKEKSERGRDGEREPGGVAARVAFYRQLAKGSLLTD